MWFLVRVYKLKPILLFLQSIMEWTREQKAGVKRLLTIIVSESLRDRAWDWVKKSILTVERKLMGRWQTWEIAHALLLAQCSRWPLTTWRENLPAIRQWQMDTPGAITCSSAYEHVSDLCDAIQDRGMYNKVRTDVTLIN